MAPAARVFLVTPFSHTSAGNEDPAIYARVQQAVEEGVRLAGVTLVHPRAIQEQVSDTVRAVAAYVLQELRTSKT